MRAVLTRRREWPVARFLPTVTILILALLSVLPLRFPDYAAVAPLLALAGLYYWTIYRPELLPPAAVFLCGVVLDLLSGAPLGIAALVFLLTRVVVLPQRRFFVDRLFPFVWGGFTLLAAGVIAFLWLLGSVLSGVVLDMRAATLQWVLTVASFPAVAYLLVRVQRGFLPSP
jgi:rod shape-determining protein MreD